MNASSIPRTKVLSKDIQDDGVLSVSSIEVDDLDEKSTGHNIVSAVPITGNAPSLTLTGPLDFDGQISGKQAFYKVTASDTVLLKSETDVEYTIDGNPTPLSNPTWFLPPYLRVGTVRVKATIKRTGDVATDPCIEVNGGTRTVLEAPTVSDTWHDVTLSSLSLPALSVGSPIYILPWFTYAGGDTRHYMIRNIRICGTLITTHFKKWEKVLE